MFLVLSSWQSHCESSHGSSDESCDAYISHIFIGKSFSFWDLVPLTTTHGIKISWYRGSCSDPLYWQVEDEVWKCAYGKASELAVAWDPTDSAVACGLQESNKTATAEFIGLMAHVLFAGAAGVKSSVLCSLSALTSTAISSYLSTRPASRRCLYSAVRWPQWMDWCSRVWHRTVTRRVLALVLEMWWHWD